MKTLKIIEKKKELGDITWESPDKINIDIADSEISSGIKDLLKIVRDTGLPLRGGEIIEKEDQKIYIEKVENIKPNDDKFLNALSDNISHVDFHGRKIFGILKR